MPSQITATYGLVPAPELSIDTRIFREDITTLPAEALENAQALIDGSDATTVVRSGETADTAILLKFDPLICGYPYFDITARGGEVIEIAVGETIPGEYEDRLPACPRLVRETHLDCARVVRYTARPGRQRYEKFDWTAVRYVMLVARQATKGLEFHDVGVVQTQYPAECRGQFDCSDPFLNDLWRIGSYTLLQCTHDAWVDGPGREKRQWLGDGIVHYLVSAASFGPETDAVDSEFLIQAAENRRADGLLPMFYPGDHHDHSLVIPDFNLHWICGVYNYYLHSGNDELAASLYSTVEQVLDWFTLHIGPNHLLANLPHWHFIEWANVGREQESATINAMFVGALRAAAELARHLGYERLAIRYRVMAQRVADALNRRHWNSDRGVYVDTVNVESGRQGARVSQHANAAMILWDIAPRARWQAMIERITDGNHLKLTAAPPIVCTGEPFDPARDIVRANTFFNHFVYGALAKAGCFATAVELFRLHYGPMLASGTSTLWESYEPSASTCHAFSASPVYQLSAHALGVRPAEPGFRRFIIAPQLCGLDYARGIYPSIHGDISIDWELSSETLRLRVHVPEGTEGRAVAPSGFALEGDPQLPPGDYVLSFVRSGKSAPEAIPADG